MRTGAIRSNKFEIHDMIGVPVAASLHRYPTLL